MGVDSGDQDSGFEAMEDFEFDDSEFVIRIRDVLNSAVKGDMVEYNKLVAVFYRKKYYSPNDVASLVTSLKALSGAVMYIDRLVHESLLEAIFTMSLWDYGPDVMDALMELIISLATLSGKYVDMCLEMIVSNFIPSHTFMPILGQQKGFTRTDEVQSRIHSAMKDIADLAPLSTMRLMSIIIQKKPNFRFQEKLLILYVENMLKMESGELGELARGTMLSGVVDLLLELDVEIGWDHILQPDNTKGVFNMEIADIEDDSDGEFEQNELPTEINRKVLGGNVLAEKLDKLMVLTFEHLQSCKDGGRLVQVFENLLQSFQNTVLTAYKSKFTQFVMFFACTLDPENCGTRFATVLTDIFVSDHCPTLHRMSAAAYLASYLSRGQFLSVSVIWDVLKRLVDWCFSYCTMQTGVIDPKAHRIFYSGCQAIMYVLCFRMRSILTDPWFKQQLFALPFDKILTHQLSPLQVCLPSIVTEFLEQAKAAGLFNSSDKFLFDDYLESESSKAFGGVERLDMFFPFDPCLLKQSERFIRPNYIFWSMVRATYFDEDEDLSDGEADQNGNGDEMNAKSLEENDLDDFDDALNKMSITPRETFLNRHSQMPSKIRPSTSPESL